MKITFVLPCTGISGGIRVLSIYAYELQRRGHEVFVISQPHKPAPLKKRIRTAIQGDGWSALRPEKQKSFFDGIPVPHRVIERQRPITDADVPDADVVIATWWETAEWVAGLSARKGKKAYFIQHHEVFDHLPKSRVEATYLLPMKKITISKWLAEIMNKKYGDNQVLLIPNGVDTRHFYAEPRKRNAVPRIGFMYSTIYWKGYRTCLEAVSLMSRWNPDLRIVAFGQEEPSLDLPIPQGTEYFNQPRQDKLKDIYGQCDIWLCSSHEEGFGLPILEAMACRCPVVSTAVGGAIDLIEEGRNGYIVPVGDPVALADRVAKILALSNTEWRAMSEAAYRTAKSYTWDNAVTLFEQAIKTVANPGNDARA
jgi:glycosyltransferase involved in cell wall biosynthesis